MRQHPRLLRFGLSLLLLCVAAGLTACSGFQLRGTESVSLKPLAGQQIVLGASVADTAFQAALRKALAQAGAQVLTQATASSIELAIPQYRLDKTVSAYSSARQVREFNHFVELALSAKRANANPDTPPFQVNLRTERIQVYDSRYVLGLAEEEREIQAELRAEAARLVALRLRALTAETAAP